MDRIIKRGDIYYAELNPVIGSEQGGTKPVLIISNDMGTGIARQSLLPLSQARHRQLPTHTEVKNFEGLDRDSIVLFEQIRTIDRKRLKQYMGMMPDEAMARVDKALAISIALTQK